MRNLNLQAVRAFQRLLEPELAQLAEGFELDRQFDGGEFSGPAFGRSLDAAQERIAKAVGSRFGVDPDDLAYQALAIANYHQDRCLDAVIARNNAKRKAG